MSATSTSSTMSTSFAEDLARARARRALAISSAFSLETGAAEASAKAKSTDSSSLQCASHTLVESSSVAAAPPSNNTPARLAFRSRLPVPVRAPNSTGTAARAPGTGTSTSGVGAVSRLPRPTARRMNRQVPLATPAASQPKVVSQPPRKQLGRPAAAASQPPRRQTSAARPCAVKSNQDEQDARVKQQLKVALKNTVESRCRIIKKDPKCLLLCIKGPVEGRPWRHTEAGLEKQGEHRQHRYAGSTTAYADACNDFDRPSGSSRKAVNRLSTAPKAKGVRFADDMVSDLRWIPNCTSKKGRGDGQGDSYWESTAEELAELRARPVPVQK